MLTIKVLYSCYTCGLTKAGCDVPARGSEDVKVWMDQTLHHLAADHVRRSPGCVPVDGMLHDLMIPITAATKVGGVPSH